MTVDDLATPSVLLERSRVEANLSRMQQLADVNGVALRPHTKTHKSIRLASWQRELGAVGITVAKVGEAEVYAKAGFDDIRIAYCTVGTEKWERIANLAKTCRISFCVDNANVVRAASKVFEAAGVVVPVLIEIDSGYGRCGLFWESDDAVELARVIEEQAGLSFGGILTHAGDSYRGPASEMESREQALRRVSISERDRMLAVGARLAAAALKPAVISVGSTPSMRYFENREYDGLRVTEIRPGNYIFNDLTQYELGVATLQQCAQTVLATVVSLHRESDGSERFFLDAGKKVMTSDPAFGRPGFGGLLYNARAMVLLPHATINALSEEHGWVSVPGGATVEVGDRMRLVTNHSCVVMNTQRSVFLVDGDEVVEEITVDAQSTVT